jgi:hypothetical protein
MAMRRRRSLRLLIVGALLAWAWVGPVDPASAQVEEPAITVTPSTGLVDGQLVRVEGTGFNPGSTVYVGACPPGATDPFSCDLSNVVTTAADASGGFSVDFRAYRFLDTAGGVDCVDVTCLIGATDLGALTALTEIHFADAPDPVLTLDVSPDTDLSVGDTVTVTGSGFSPFVSVTLRMCPTEVDPGLCTQPFGSSGVVTVSADGDGAFETGFDVSRFVPFPGDSGTYDCATGSCSVAADSRTGTTAAPVSFAPPTEVLQVTPATNLQDDQVVQVIGSGFPPEVGVAVLNCIPAGAFSAFSDCDLEHTTSLTTSASGTFTSDHTVDRFVLGQDCLLTECEVTAVFLSNGTVAARLGITFATPALSIDIENVATLRAGTNDAVAQALITCDVATPVSLVGSISQPGITSEWVLSAQPCDPTEPLRAFIPARSIESDGTDYALGDATVEVSAWPVANLPGAGSPPDAVVASETVQLVDFDELKAVIDSALADPANEELRAAVLRAIQLRVQQDPVFRAEFAAAIAALLSA